MRSGDELEGRLDRDRVDRHPHRDVLEAVDVVEGLVLVPWRSLPGLRRLREHVIVVEPNGRARHELLGDRGRGRLADELAVFVDALPVPEVLDELPGIIGVARDEGERARVGEIPIDAASDEGDLLGRERPTDDDCSVPGEIRGSIGRELEGACHAASIRARGPGNERSGQMAAPSCELGRRADREDAVHMAATSPSAASVGA